MKQLRLMRAFPGKGRPQKKTRWLSVALLLLLLLSNVAYAQCPGSPPLSATLAATDVVCGNDGIITVNATGGIISPTYLFRITAAPSAALTTSWQSSNEFNGLIPGSYTVEIMDDCGSLTDTVSIGGSYQSPEMESFYTHVSSCGTLGTITANMSEGNAPYEYRLVEVDTNWGSSGNFTGLATGTYTLQGRDNCGNEKQRTIVIISRPPSTTRADVAFRYDSLGRNCMLAEDADSLIASVSLVDIVYPVTVYVINTTSGGSDTLGTSVINSGDPLPAYTVPYRTGGVQSTIQVTVVNACGNTFSRSRITAEPELLLSWIELDCAGPSFVPSPVYNLAPSWPGRYIEFYDATGTVLLATDTFLTPHNKTRSLTEGTTYVIRGYSPCGDLWEEVTVTTPSSATFAPAITVSGYACTAGMAVVTVGRSSLHGGWFHAGSPSGLSYRLISGDNTTLSYPFSITPYTSNGIRDALEVPFGNFQLEVSNSCYSDTFSISITDTLSRSTDYTVTPGCAGSSAITANLTSNDDRTAAFLLLDSAGAIVDGPVTINDDVAGGGTETFDFLNLYGGPYALMIIDNGCTDTLFNGVVNVPYPGEEPVLTGSRAILCDDSTATLSVNVSDGVPPYTFEYKSAGAPVSAYEGTGQSSPVFSGLAAGSYDVRVTDDCGTTATANLSVAVLAPPLIALSDSTCSGQDITLSPDVIAGANYKWTDPSGTVLQDGTIPALTLTSLAPADSGIYALEVIIGGCATVIRNIDIDVHPTPVADAGTYTEVPCEGTPYALAASLDAGATGLWTSDNPSEVSFDDSTSATTAVTFANEAVYNIAWTVTSAAGCTATDPVTFSVSCDVLPLTLLSFSARLQNTASVLRWTTAAEDNLDYFNIQHSADGTKFESIGRIKAAGNSNEQLHYEFIHPAPVTGNNYYRLQNTDADGTYNYSEVRTVVVAAATGVQVSPNPATSYVNIKAKGIKDIVLFDVTGRAVAIDAVSGNDDLVSISTATLPSGVYLLSVLTESGIARCKLIVNK